MNNKSGKLREYNRFIDYFYENADLEDPESCEQALKDIADWLNLSDEQQAVLKKEFGIE